MGGVYSRDQCRKGKGRGTPRAHWDPTAARCGAWRRCRCNTKEGWGPPVMARGPRSDALHLRHHLAAGQTLTSKAPSSSAPLGCDWSCTWQTRSTWSRRGWLTWKSSRCRWGPCTLRTAPSAGGYSDHWRTSAWSVGSEVRWVRQDHGEQELKWSS